jgi:hypothetical protein
MVFDVTSIFEDFTALRLSALAASFLRDISAVSHSRSSPSETLILINHSRHVVTAISPNDYHELFLFFEQFRFKTLQIGIRRTAQPLRQISLQPRRTFGFAPDAALPLLLAGRLQTELDRIRMLSPFPH